MSTGTLIEPRIALLHAISRELAKTQTLPNMLGGILRISAESVSADLGSVALLDDGGQINGGVRLVDDTLILDVHKHPETVTEQGVIDHVATHKQAVNIGDTSDDPRWDDSEEGDGGCAVYATPIVGPGEVPLGVLTVIRNKPQAFDQNDEILLNAVAQMCTTPVMNMRLQAENQRHMDTIAVLAETSQIINSTIDPKKIISFLLERTVSMIGTRSASLALVSANDKLVFEAATGIAADEMIGLELTLGQGVAGWVAETGRPALVSNAGGDKRFFSGVDAQTGFSTQAILCVPIQAQGQILGIIEALNPERGYFDDHDLQLLTNIANMAGNALLHARDYASVPTSDYTYTELFEDSVNMILISDQYGKIVDTNTITVKKLGFANEELLDKSILALHGLKSDYLAQLLEGKEITLETSIMTKDQNVIPVEVMAKSTQVDGKTLIQWTERDISHRRQMEAFRTDLTAMLFHDLRSPLGNVISSLDLLGNISAPDSATASISELALRSARRLSRLIDSLLDLTRLEDGRIVLQRDAVDLAALLAESVEQTRVLADGKDIKLTVEGIEQILVLDLDADMMQRVLINVTENAIKYTQGGGSVHVQLGVVGDEAMVSVTDTGIGIPEEELNNIFHKFTRVRRKTSHNPKGLGLGLSFCKLAVEAHHGRIWVESEEGVGSTFKIALPVDLPSELASDN